MKTKLIAAACAVSLTLICGAAGGAVLPVVDAAGRGDTDAVRVLLRSGADVNMAQGDGMTALHWAAERGDAGLAEVLVYAGANVEAGTRIGRYTSLHMAARQGHADVAIVLLEAGSDPAAVTSNSGVTPLHLAAASGDAETVVVLLQAGADANVAESAWGQTPLIFAAAAGRTEAIQALLDAGADPAQAATTVDVVDQEKGDKAAEKRLSQFLADFKEKEGGDTDWQPAPAQVQAAIAASREIQRKWPDVPDPEKDDQAAPVKYNADGQPVYDYDDDEEEGAEKEAKPASYGELVGKWGGLTPLLHAARQGHADAAVTLIDGGADINQPSAGDRTTPLLMASLNGHFDLALTLLEMGADPNLASSANTTPLFAVLERNWAPRASYAHPIEHQQQNATHLEVMEGLLEAGADPNVRLSRHLWYMEYTFSVLKSAGINLTGATPFWRASQALDLDAMMMLKGYGADPEIPTIKTPQRRRDDCEQLAAQIEDEPLAPVEPCIPKEEQDFSSVPEVPVGGPFLYPIHAAAGAGYGQWFAGNAHRHAPDNWLPTVKFLVEECGADVNLRDANAYTALHHAASRGDSELVQYLVDQGADVMVVSRKGQTTADMANGPIERVPPYPGTIELLVALGAINNNNCVSC